MKQEPLPISKIYPTLQEAQTATLNQLQDWYKSLPSPGFSSAHLPPEQFLNNKQQEEEILLTIIRRIYDETTFD